MVKELRNLIIDFLVFDSGTDDDQGLTASRQQEKLSCLRGKKTKFLVSWVEDKGAHTPADGTPHLFKVFPPLSSDVEVLK